MGEWFFWDVIWAQKNCKGLVKIGSACGGGDQAVLFQSTENPGAYQSEPRVGVRGQEKLRIDPSIQLVDVGGQRVGAEPLVNGGVKQIFVADGVLGDGALQVAERAEEGVFDFAFALGEGRSDEGVGVLCADEGA